jgi:acetyl esterase/lipase
MKRISLDEVAPEFRAHLRRLPRPRIHNALCRGFQRWADARARDPKMAGLRIEWLRREGPGLRLYHPEVRQSRGALLWIHGGGYVTGHPAQNDALCAATAQELGILVVAPAYRLAPEHRYPAALDDCHAAWRWMLDAAARLGVDPARIAIGGESAGGGLAAGLVQRLHDEHRDDPLGPKPVAQWLFCPMIDDRTAADRNRNRNRNAHEHFVWSNDANAFGWQAYLGEAPGSPSPPRYAAPARRADLHGLPQAWIGTSGLDVLHDEDRTYAERLEAAGIAVRLVDFPAAPHGFHAFAPDSPMSRGFVADARLWLERAIAAG